MLAESMGETQERTRFLNEALAAFDPVKSQNKFQLGWFLTAARMDGDVEAANRAAVELGRREREGEKPSEIGALLPEIDTGRVST